MKKEPVSFLCNGCTLLDICTKVQPVIVNAIMVASVSLEQMARARVK